MAAAHGSADVTQLLLEHGAPLNLRTLPVPYTDLDQNADMQEDGEEGVKGMAKWKASLWGDAATERHFGWGSSTPLMEAVARGHYDAAAVLLRRGADANIPNDVRIYSLILSISLLVFSYLLSSTIIRTIIHTVMMIKVDVSLQPLLKLNVALLFTTGWGDPTAVGSTFWFRRPSTAAT